MDRNVIRRALRGCVGAALIIAGACSTAPAPPAVAPALVVPAEPPAAAAPKIDLDRLDALLERGDRAYKDGRLLTPIDDCAYDYYREALAVAPNHPAALHGLERVADRYVAMAEQAAEKGQYDAARKLLARARLGRPGSRRHRHCRDADRATQCRRHGSTPRSTVTSSRHTTTKSQHV